MRKLENIKPYRKAPKNYDTFCSFSPSRESDPYSHNLRSNNRPQKITKADCKMGKGSTLTVSWTVKRPFFDHFPKPSGTGKKIKLDHPPLDLMISSILNHISVKPCPKCKGGCKCSGTGIKGVHSQECLGTGLPTHSWPTGQGHHQLSRAISH